MSHFILKLTSGEIVYGTVDLNSGDKKMIIVKNPLIWEEYESPDGYVGTALVKYLNGTAETQIPLAITSIVSMASMSPTFSQFYDAAVAVQKITDEAYDEKIAHMTKKMKALVTDYQSKVDASQFDGLVAFPTDTDSIH